MAAGRITERAWSRRRLRRRRHIGLVILLSRLPGGTDGARYDDVSTHRDEGPDRGGRPGVHGPRHRAGPAEARGAAERHHDAAARVRPQRAAQRLLRRSGRDHRRSVVQRAPAGERADPAPVDGGALVGGAGVERPGALPRLERHPQRPAAALAGGRRSRHRVPRAVEQQQRQHVRLPGPPALVRAPDTARGALRERRRRHADRRPVRRQAAELAQRRGRASRRLVLVHRPAVRRPALRGRARRGGRAEQPRRPAQSEARPAARHRRIQTRASARRLSRRSERPRGPRDHRTAGVEPEWPLLLAGLREALRGEHRPRARRHRSRRQPRHPRLRHRPRPPGFRRQGVHRLHGGRRQVRPRRFADRRRGQPVGIQQRRPQRRLQRRDRLEPGRQAHRTHPAPGGVRQHLLRRAQAQPPLQAASQSLYAVYVSTQGAGPG